MISMSTVPMKIAKIGYILLSVAFVLIGVFLVFVPEFSVQVACDILGGAMIAFGAVKIVGFLSKDLYRLAFQFDLSAGILFIVLGILVLAYPEQTVAFFSIVLGITILADGLAKVQISMDSKRFGLDKWWMILVLALISGIAAVILIFYPRAGGQVLITIFGIALICEGVQNIIAALYLVKIIKHQLPDDDMMSMNDY